MSDDPVKTFMLDEEIQIVKNKDMRHTGERQIYADITKIAPDHLKRYQWASRYLRGVIGKDGQVIDVGCGNGYGSWTLADYGLRVVGFDVAQEAVDFAAKSYKHERNAFARLDCGVSPFPKAQAAVAFEIIEHLEDDDGVLRRLADAAPHVLISVPNEAVVPWSKESHPFHLRHYTAEQLEAKLLAAGLRPVEWLTQYDKWTGDLKAGKDGRTLIVATERVEP